MTNFITCFASITDSSLGKKIAKFGPGIQVDYFEVRESRIISLF
ncbi:hypothetical protein V461_06355 [Pantoea ananatis BRT98]|nr:hypothetical protein V461_06355 [Pantoea ananatis BRT98]